jgi:hypothetical protein
MVYDYNMKNNKNPIVIYWSPFMSPSEPKINWTFLYPEPKNLFSDMVKNKTKDSGKDSYFACPAVTNKFKHTFVFFNSLKSSHRYDYTEGKKELELLNDYGLHLQKKRVSSLDSGPVLLYSLSYLFFSEESLDACFTPPMFHKPGYTKYACAMPGEFNIGEWFRPYDFEVQTWSNKGEIHIEEDEPIFYVEFKTDRPVILKKFECNDTLRLYAESNAISTFIFGRGESLLKKYKRFKDVGFREKILTEIKKNLIEEHS